MRRFDIVVSALALALALNGTALAASKSDKKQAQHQALVDKKNAAQERNSDAQDHKKSAGTGFTIKAPRKSGNSSWLTAKQSSLAEKSPRRRNDLAHP
jgi:hypothetical protein